MKKKIHDFVRWAHIEWLRRSATSANDINLSGRVLIVAPHPDDEVIGCGGLIARLVAEGNAPYIVVMTGGEGSQGKDYPNPNEIVKARRGLTRKAMHILGVPEQNLHELNFPDGGISEASHEIEKLREIINTLKPDTVLVPHWGEGWPDHVRTAEIVKGLVPSGSTIWEYCVWMWYYNVWRGLDWKNAAVLKMAPAEHELKLKAVNAYVKPLAPCGKPWSGVLPKLFVEANTGNTELYFKCGTSK